MWSPDKKYPHNGGRSTYFHDPSGRCRRSSPTHETLKPARECKGSLYLRFTMFQAIYAGGVASSTNDSRFRRVDPATYH
ncbi:hypothetical protein FF36_06338 [Frankia torreyi]|uniref:Uncharacterized protein n=1 Tax=Frankia torreyi TaxID=1856 RepID=A0A0D8B5C4_9ACTN|nr:hypothetical protein FF36_06338 [Frankia torreyi]KQM02630.1 hypothetical protein FF86_106021 [Frankia sp. CpI1-P]